MPTTTQRTQAPLAQRPDADGQMTAPAAAIVADIRYSNYMALFDNWKRAHPQLAGHGALRRFAAAIGISERQASHLKGRRREIGNATARHIEQQLRLPRGYMDVQHGPLRAAPPPKRARAATPPQPIAPMTEGAARDLFAAAYRIDPAAALAALRGLCDAAIGKSVAGVSGCTTAR